MEKGKKEQRERVQTYVPKVWKIAIKELADEVAISESSIVKLALERYLREKNKI